MTTGTRLIVFGAVLAFSGLIYIAHFGSQSRLWEERSGIRVMQAYTAKLAAERTGKSADLAVALRKASEATTSSAEYFRTETYVACGVIAIGAIFCLIGFSVSGGARPQSERTP